MKQKEEKCSENKSTKKQKNSTICIISCTFIIFLILSICIVACANRFSANTASIIGGVLGAAATVFLGLIAFWQNKQYKEMADRLNMRTVMPEVFLLKPHEVDGSCVNDETLENYNVIRIWQEAKNICLIQIDMSTLNLPVINMKVTQVEIGGVKHESFKEQTSTSIFIPNSQFVIELGIDEDLQHKTTNCKLLLCYENIYSDKFVKQISFDLSPSYDGEWKIENAKTKQCELVEA